MIKKLHIVSMPVSQLTEDMDLYPRHAVDPSHVSNLAYALEAGHTLPPIIADKESKRITDGWHRARAYRKAFGDGATVEVELIEYKDRAEMLFDAIHRNSSHGRRLDSMDMTRSVVMLQSCNVSRDRIALALHVTEDRVEKIRIRVGTVKKSNPNAVPGTNKITLKRSVNHLDGQKITDRQADAHKSMPGTSFTLIAKQLRMALEENLTNLENDQFIKELRLLKDQLDTILAAV